MKQIQIGICDDEPYFLEQLNALVSACGNECKLDFNIVTYGSANELVGVMEDGKKEFDLLFLDVEMPEMMGVDAAKRLRKNGYEGIVCFVTSHESYALEAYGVEALGYLIKPAQYEDVKRLVKKAVVQIAYSFNEKEAEKRYLKIHTQRTTVPIDTHQILYIEKRRNQCVFHLEDGEMVCYETLQSIFDRLDRSQFCYSHQGFLVNFDKVKEVQQNSIMFGMGREAPVSRKYYKGLKERKLKEIYALRNK